MAPQVLYHSIMSWMMKMKKFSDQRFQCVHQIVDCSVVLIILKLARTFFYTFFVLTSYNHSWNHGKIYTIKKFYAIYRNSKQAISERQL